MALYAFDGTWDSAKEGEDPQYTNSNVVRFYEAYRRGRRPGDDLYVPGVGTRFDLLGKLAGGLFGMGELPRIDEAYEHLCERWAAGDHVIDIVGFSRGAATTLDFCHRIQTDGIRRPRARDVVERHPVIRFLGVWDVVAAFGVANLGNTELNVGHHLTLPASGLQYCFHAMALDERRLSFLPTRLEGACEVWFRGVHSDVGGGNGNRGLNDITLKWMMSKAKAAGLPLTDDDIAALLPDPAAVPRFDPKLRLRVRLISALDRRHYSVRSSAEGTNPPATCPVETPGDEAIAIPLDAPVQVLPAEARARVDALWAAAERAAKDLDFPLGGARDALLTLFQGRIALVTTDADLQRAREAVVQLVATMVDGAQRRHFHVVTEFFLTETLFRLRPLFPFAD
jgi:hypothetical protein